MYAAITNSRGRGRDYPPCIQQTQCPFQTTNEVRRGAGSARRNGIQAGVRKLTLRHGNRRFRQGFAGAGTSRTIVAGLDGGIASQGPSQRAWVQRCSFLAIIPVRKRRVSFH